MPKRTNDFQRLVAVIQSHLDPGSKVVESELLPDATTGTRREADIVVTGTVGGQNVTVSIECRDRGRPADVTWVDEMQAKHSRLATNVLVLVSHSGFTQEALNVAKVLGIRCLPFADIDSDEPSRLFPEGTLWGKSWEVAVDRVEVTVAANETMPSEWFRARNDHDVFDEAGEQCAKLGDVVQILLRSERIKTHMFDEARPDHTFLELEWERPEAGGLRLCVQKVEPKILRPIDRLRVVARCNVVLDSFPLRHGQFDKVRVAYGTGSILGKQALLVATATESGEGKISLRFTDTEPKSDRAT